jgi:hypothetical protein
MSQLMALIDKATCRDIGYVPPEAQSTRNSNHDTCVRDGCVLHVFGHLPVVCVGPVADIVVAMM